MAPTKRHLAVTQRNLVVDLVKQGKTYREVQKITGVAFTTVSNIMKKYKTFGTTDDVAGRGRKRKTSKAVDRNIIIHVKKNRFESAQKIAARIEESHGIIITPQTVRNRIHEQGFRGRTVRKKPFLSNKHMKRRLDFAKKYANMPLSFWKKIIWSDESKFNLKSSDGIQKVWRKVGEAFKLSCTRGTVKFGGGNIMVWGCMSWRGVGLLEFIDDKMNADLYINILKKNLKMSARKFRLGNNYIFQQDNDPKHTAKKTTEFFKENHINLLEWPAQSPDLNPIEHLWAILDRKIGDRSFSKKGELKEAVKKAWNEIKPEEVQKLIESMPRRLSAVIEAKGGATKY